MSDLYGNHIVGFPTRRLKYSSITLIASPELLSGCIETSGIGDGPNRNEQ